MSNIMSMLNLKNKVSRNGFDLSEKVAFTAKVGELLPIVTKEVIPGDKFKIDLKWFTRTRPVNTAAYTRMREYYDFFFVPTRLLWKDFQPFVTSMTENTTRAASISTKTDVTDRHPYFTVKQIADCLNAWKTAESASKGFNIFGFSRSDLSCKLLSYLGYGSFYPYQTKAFNTVVNSSAQALVNLSLNPFPLLAYQKIYQDFYRDAQWESAQPWTYNVDYLSGSNLQIPISNLNGVEASYTMATMLDMQYCNWNKDLFMGLLPNSQYGAEAFSIVRPDRTPLYLSYADGTLPNDQSTVQIFNVDDSTSTLATLANPSRGLYFKKDSTVGQLSILALRQAEFLQKWKEIAQSGQQDYKHQIEKHFGVSVPDSMSDHVKYIGGTADNIDISEVVNTNITSTNESDIAGKGAGVGRGTISFEAKEHGILMCVYHCIPLLDYATNGVDKFNQKTYFTDYAQPEFDRIGMQSVDISQLSNDPTVMNLFVSRSATDNVQLGYAPRYIDYKTSYDKIRGGFQFTDLASWCAPVSDKYVENYIQKFVSSTSSNIYKYAFMKVNPQVLDTIFGVAADASIGTDQFLVNSAFDIKAVRNLDTNGLPY